MRWRTLMFVLVGMAGAVLFAESLGAGHDPDHVDHAEHADHAAHAGPVEPAGHSGRQAGAHRHGDPGTAAFTRPVGVLATFAAAGAVCWLVSRRRRPADADADTGTDPGVGTDAATGAVRTGTGQGPRR
ncbi:MAG TPA: hypothetical protein VFX70_14620 [Mycobacteriales bacterium]|nr:hypothetical protein [Mycobacteriales bacterium]